MSTGRSTGRQGGVGVRPWDCLLQWRVGAGRCAKKQGCRGRGALRRSHRRVARSVSIPLHHEHEPPGQHCWGRRRGEGQVPVPLPRPAARACRHQRLRSPAPTSSRSALSLPCRGAGVVREDPLELAWAPAARPRLHATAAAGELRSGEGHSVGQAAVLAAQSAQQLVRSRSAEGPSGPGRGAGGTPARQLQQMSADVAAEEGAREQPPAILVAAAADSPSNGGSTGAALLGRLQGSLSGSGTSTGLSAPGMSERERQVEEILNRLQALPWRRVDVCFGATLLPLLSHQHIQARRERREVQGARRMMRCMEHALHEVVESCAPKCPTIPVSLCPRRCSAGGSTGQAMLLSSTWRCSWRPWRG